jgi:hypothetical protein
MTPTPIDTLATIFSQTRPAAEPGREIVAIL